VGLTVADDGMDIIEPGGIATLTQPSLCGNCRGVIDLSTVLDGQRYQCRCCGQFMRFTVRNGIVTQHPEQCQ
jgi:hypothetical protein